MQATAAEQYSETEVKAEGLEQDGSQQERHFIPRLGQHRQRLCSADKQPFFAESGWITTAAKPNLRIHPKDTFIRRA